MEIADAGRRPCAQVRLRARAARTVDPQEIHAPVRAWVRRHARQGIERNRQLCGPARWRQPGAAGEAVHVPREIFPPAVCGPPQDQVAQRSQRIDLDFKITLQIAHRINEHLDRLLGPEWRVMRGQRGPGVCVVSLEKQPPFPRVPGGADPGFLPRRGPADVIPQLHGRNIFPKSARGIGGQRFQDAMARLQRRQTGGRTRHVRPAAGA